MRPRLALTVVLLLLLVAGTVAVLSAGGRPAPEDPVRASSARPAGYEAAFRALDLIKPSRQKVADDFTLPTPTSEIGRAHV